MKKLEEKYILCYKYFIYKIKFQKFSLEKYRIEGVSSKLSFAIVFTFLFSIYWALFTFIIILMLDFEANSEIVTNLSLFFLFSIIGIFILFILLETKFEKKLINCYEETNIDYKHTANFKKGRKFIRNTIIAFIIINCILLYYVYLHI